MMITNFLKAFIQISYFHVIHNCSHFHIFSVVRLYSGKIDTIYVDSKDLPGFDCNDQYLGSRWEDRRETYSGILPRMCKH